MKTFNRGTLKKLAQQGKLVRVSSYHFDDMTGETRSTGEALVRIKKDSRDWIEGQCNMVESDFTGKSGRAWENPDGTITLKVHSNLDFTFRKIDSAS